VCTDKAVPEQIETKMPGDTSPSTLNDIPVDRRTTTPATSPAGVRTPTKTRKRQKYKKDTEAIVEKTNTKTIVDKKEPDTAPPATVTLNGAGDVTSGTDERTDKDESTVVVVTPSPAGSKTTDSSTIKLEPRFHRDDSETPATSSETKASGTMVYKARTTRSSDSATDSTMEIRKRTSRVQDNGETDASGNIVASGSGGGGMDPSSVFTASSSISSSGPDVTVTQRTNLPDVLPAVERVTKESTVTSLGRRQVARGRGRCCCCGCWCCWLLLLLILLLPLLFFLLDDRECSFLVTYDPAFMMRMYHPHGPPPS
jgi:hypothetical protein